MTEVNIPLLRKAVEWVEEEAQKPLIDRRWYQDDWVRRPDQRADDITNQVAAECDAVARFEFDFERVEEVLAEHCGTAYCVAGYIGQMLDKRYEKSTVVDGVHVSVFAADALGIQYETVPVIDMYDAKETHCEAVVDLFNGWNDAETIRAFAEQYAGEKL